MDLTNRVQILTEVYDIHTASRPSQASQLAEVTVRIDREPRFKFWFNAGASHSYCDMFNALRVLFWANEVDEAVFNGTVYDDNVDFLIRWIDKEGIISHTCSVVWSIYA